MTAPRPYQVLLYIGPNVPAVPGVTVADVTPAEPTAEAVLAAVTATGLTPADLRSRVLVVADCDPRTAVLTYAALIGFAGRRLDVATSVDGDVVELAEFDAAVRALPDHGRPAEPVEHLQVGAAHEQLPSLVVASRPSPEQISALRYARRVRFVAPADTTAALVQLVTVAALRARGTTDRLPFLVAGDEPAVGEDSAGEVVGICLNTLNRDSLDLRRSLRTGGRDSLTEAVPGDARTTRLLEAAALPVEQTLVRLGASSSGVGEEQMWHCPRPSRHTNGDQTPSMRVVKEKVRCFRCDPERVDSLRLAMDTLGVSPDEAADWLLSPAVLPPLRPAAAA